MNSIKYIIISVLLLIIFRVPLVNAEVVVIVHPENSSSIAKKDVKRIFLGKTKKFSNGNSVTVINLPAANETRKTFDKTSVGKSSKQMKAYWAKLIFSGKGSPPKEVANDAEVISIVASDQNAIGYIDSANVNSSIKVVGN